MPNNKVKIVQQALAAVKKSFPKAPKGMRIKALIVVVKTADGKQTRRRVGIGRGPKGLSFKVGAPKAAKPAKPAAAPAT